MRFFYVNRHTRVVEKVDVTSVTLFCFVRHTVKTRNSHTNKRIKKMLSTKTLRNLLTSVFALVLVIAGCSTSPQSDTGTLQVRMVDAPIDNAKEVNVVINSVQVNNTETDTGWVTINEPKKTYNLLDLTNGAYAVLGEAELEAGTYEQIRLILDSEGNNIVFENGDKESLFIPSGTQTGVKLNVNAEIEPGFTYTLILDFNASKSVVKAGNSGRYLLKPVIRATNLATTGKIAGTVLPAEAEAKVHAIAGEDTLTTTFANTTDGTYELVGLEDGAYTVAFEPRETGYVGSDTTGVEVAVGETNNIGTVELETQN